MKLKECTVWSFNDGSDNLILVGDPKETGIKAHDMMVDYDDTRTITGRTTWLSDEEISRIPEYSG